MPESKEPTNCVVSVHLTFEHTVLGGLHVAVDGGGISFSRNDNSLLLTKFEAMQIQRALRDACSGVWGVFEGSSSNGPATALEARARGMMNDPEATMHGVGDRMSAEPSERGPTE